MFLTRNKIAHMFACFASIGYIYGFNLETRLPVIKVGGNGSYFGYAVAAHQIRNESGNITEGEGLILVGAPLGKNLQPNTTRSGGLWKCPLTNNRNDCSQVITDGRKDPISGKLNRNKSLEVESDSLYAPAADEDKEDQWLGVTVKSQGPGGKVLVCAHRYKMNNTMNILGLGFCYTLKPDLQFDSTLNHCHGLSTSDLQMDYGLCQLGTSGMIFEDDNAIIGAPGSLDWRGAIFVSSVSDEVLYRDGSVYKSNAIENRGPDVKENIPKFGYMGMSVTAGYFIGDNITVFVAGSPRGNEIGQVVLFLKQSNTHGSIKVTLEEYLIIKGEQIASYFGHEVIGADVNGDGLPDLLVAAPFYFTNDVGGAIYIYMNDPVNHLKNVVPIKLTGKPESRFGFSLVSLGDLNKDKYEDIAVGAPYEGNGVVYIYLGSKDGLLTKPKQIINAEMVTPSHMPLSTFGYSLSGGIDLDSNGYPDLVIGAYETDSVILLRARPIINIRTSVRSATGLSNFDPTARNCLISNNTNYIPCFHFETCCIIDPIIKARNSPLRIQYELNAETFSNHRNTSRIWFDDFSSKSHIIQKTISVSTLRFCQNHTAYLKENTQDIQSPIQMRLSYTLVHKEPEQPRGPQLPSLNDYPILNQLEAIRLFNATFLKDCGYDDKCDSNLVVSAKLSLKNKNHQENQYELSLGEDQRTLMNVSIINRGESAYETQLYIFLPNHVTFAKVAAVLEGNKKDYLCTDHKSHVLCKIGNPLKSNEVVSLLLEFDLQNVNGSEADFKFTIRTNTTSFDQNAEEKKIDLVVHVVEKILLSISGYSAPVEIPDFVNTELKGESAVKYKDEIGSKVTHHYTIVNNGSWPVSGITVDIEWPYQVANNKPQGKWLLYLDEPPTVEGSGSCRVPDQLINPLHLKNRDPTYTNSVADGKSSFSEKADLESGARSNRIRRDLEVVVPYEIHTNKEGNKYKLVKLYCILGNAKCPTITCDIDLIESRQTLNIMIKSRLWDATLLEDYSDVNIIEIQSRAKMHIHETKVRLENNFPNEFSIQTTARVTLHGQQSTAPIPLLIIIAAIIAGLLLFMLLTLLLWKLGFFKRRRPDPTLSGNLEKHRIEEYHDY